MCEVYKHFSKDWKTVLNYTEKDMLELFLSESYGDVKCNSRNGFYIGKKYLNTTVAMWFEDIENKTLYKYELYNDPNLPDWWLDKIFKRR